MYCPSSKGDRENCPRVFTKNSAIPVLVRRESSITKIGVKTILDCLNTQKKMGMRFKRRRVIITAMKRLEDSRMRVGSVVAWTYNRSKGKVLNGGLCESLYFCAQQGSGTRGKGRRKVSDE